MRWTSERHFHWPRRGHDSAREFAQFRRSITALPLLATLTLTGCAEVAVQDVRQHRVVVSILDSGIASLPQFESVEIEHVGRKTVSGDHGTQVASVVLRVLNRPERSFGTVQLHSFNIENLGLADPTLMADAVIEATSKGSDVINISASIPDDHRRLRLAIDKAIKANVLIVAAAGNLAGSPARYPAAYPGVISVGSMSRDGTASPFSARRGVTTAAIGEQIPALNADGTQTCSSGTSIAAAAVTAQIVTLLEDGRSHKEAIKAIAGPQKEESTGC